MARFGKSEESKVLLLEKLQKGKKVIYASISKESCKNFISELSKMNLDFEYSYKIKNDSIYFN
ncbi:hypothetical protein CJ739_75 [Mariniflexile rhizosphaerae]|uniref:hypothetical protein n=1 Tax=unclassified Mariniflexile TaxID=2643887 RepID=UPI000E32F57F|nr:hypothetical protein CJ739_75 [Mariniflexile sp. TRM1-10]